LQRALHATIGERRCSAADSAFDQHTRDRQGQVFLSDVPIDGVCQIPSHCIRTIQPGFRQGELSGAATGTDEHGAASGGLPGGDISERITDHHGLIQIDTILFGQAEQHAGVRFPAAAPFIGAMRAAAYCADYSIVLGGNGDHTGVNIVYDRPVDDAAINDRLVCHHKDADTGLSEGAQRVQRARNKTELAP
jgi:hypothetical protein